jgi:hypothetical protein
MILPGLRDRASFTDCIGVTSEQNFLMRGYKWEKIIFFIRRTMF